MSDAFGRYRSLERDLIYIRWQHAGFESKEEEPILDAMEEVWYELSEEEQQLLYSEGTKSLIEDSSIGLVKTPANSITPVRTLRGVA